MPERPKFRNGVRKEANGTWTAKYGRAWSRGHETRSKAREALHALQATKPSEKPQETVDSLAARFTRDFPRAAESTNRWYRDQLRAVATEFKGRRLSSVSKEEAYAFSRRVSPHQVRAAAAMFSEAVRLGIDGLQVNPFQNLGLAAPKGRRDIIPLTEGEVYELAQTAERVHGRYGQDVFGPMILVAAWTGLRPGELYVLGPNDIDWRNGVLEVTKSFRSGTGELVPHTKNYERRTVPIAGQLYEVLRGLERRATNELLFFTKQGKRLSQRTASYWWEPVRQAFAESLPADHWLPVRIREQGVRGNLEFYELRHFVASELLARGASRSDIAAILGHRDESTVPRYAHQRPGEASERLRGLLSGSGSGGRMAL